MSDKAGWFDGLPGPQRGKVVLWFLGPGFGESVVAALPDGRWMVVDTCTWRNSVLPKALLDHHRVGRIDLLVVTHPDLDHIGGLPALVQGSEIGRVWRYPRHADIGDLVAGWLERHHRRDGRLRVLRRALDTLDELEEGEGRVVHAAYGRDEWPTRAADYQVHLLAPPDGDLRVLGRELERLMGSEAGLPALDRSVVEYLTGRSRRRHRNANALSLALTIELGNVRVLLGGDVERGRTGRRGWQGVLHHLREDNRLRLVEDIEVAKVSHHGSRGAFHAQAWNLHAKTRRVRLAVVTPFDRGDRPPPHEQALRGIRLRSDELALTARGRGTRTVARRSGWSSLAGPAPATAPCIAVVVGPQGVETVTGGQPTQVYGR